MSTTTVTQELMNILDSHLSMIKDLTEQVKQLSVRLDGEIIIRGLRDQDISDAFATKIRNAPKEFLAGLDLDLSEYASNDSDIFDTIMAAGYDLTKSNDLDCAVNDIIDCNRCHAFAPKWREFINRINNLAKCDQQLEIDWKAAIELFDDRRMPRSDGPDIDLWGQKADEMRANMVDALAEQLD